MALLSFSPEVMRPTALILNLFVAGISFFQFWRAGFFMPKLFLVFALSSCSNDDNDTQEVNEIDGLLKIKDLTKYLKLI